MFDEAKGLPPSGVAGNNSRISDYRNQLPRSGEKSLSGKKAHSFYLPSQTKPFQSPDYHRNASFPRASQDSIEIGNDLQFSFDKRNVSRDSGNSLRNQLERLREENERQRDLKLQEFEREIIERWENKIDHLHREYKKKITNFEDTIEQSTIEEALDEEEIDDIRMELEKKYEFQYHQKVLAIKKNFEKIDEENKARVVEEITKELEPIYGEDLATKILQLEQDLHTEIEKKKTEQTVRNHGGKETLETSQGLKDKYLKYLGEGNIITEAGSNESQQAIKSHYEGMMTTLREKYEKQEKNLMKELAEAEKKAKEVIGRTLEEQMNKEFMRKEKFMDLEWRQKMEKQGNALRQKYEQQLKSQIDEEKRMLKEEKNEIGRFKSQACLKITKEEKMRKELEVKLVQQEERFMKEIAELEETLNMLKERYPYRVRSSISAQSARQQWNEGRRESVKEQGNLDYTFNVMKNKENQGYDGKKKQDPLMNKLKKNYNPHGEKSRGHSANSRFDKENSSISASVSVAEERALRELKGNENVQEVKQMYTQESKGPYLVGLNNKLRRDQMFKQSETYGTMKTIIDAMRPPDMPVKRRKERSYLMNVSSHAEKDRSRNNDQTMDKEAKSTKECETESSEWVLRNENNAAYNNLKEEILKKYKPVAVVEKKENNETKTPVKIVDEKSDIQEESRHSTSNNKREQQPVAKKAKEVKPRECQPERATEGRRRNSPISHSFKGRGSYNGDHRKSREELVRKSANIGQRGSVTSWYDDEDVHRSVMKKSDEKYVEIMNKYLAQAQKDKEIAEERMRKGMKQVGLKTKYQEIFDMREEDPAQVKSMKKWKQAIEASIEADNSLKAKYMGREIFFITEFVSGLDTDDFENRAGLRMKFQVLYQGWDRIETSYEARLRFLDEIEMIFNFDEVYKRADVEIECILKYGQEIQKIIDCLKRRNQLKNGLDTPLFEYKNYKKIYMEVDDTNHRMKNLLQEYHRAKKREVVYKGVDLSDIVKLDTWEHEFLKEKEQKELLWEVVKRRY